MVMNLMESIDRVLFDELQTICRECDRMNTYETFVESLSTLLPNGVSIYDELVAIMREGNEKDVASFVTTAFSLPLGLRLKCISSLTSIIKRLHLPSMDSVVSIEASASNEQSTNCVYPLQELWKEWKSSNLSSAQYFSKLSEFVAKGLINVDEFVMASNRALMEGGYGQMNHSGSYHSLQPSQKQFMCQYSHIATLNKLLPRSRGIIDLYSLDSLHSRISILHERSNVNAQRQTAMPSTFLSAIPCRSTQELFWEQVDDMDNLHLSNHHAMTDTSIDHAAARHLKKSKVLLIGDYLHLQSCKLEVDQVVAVDGVTVDSTRTSFKVAIVIKGRLSRTSIGINDQSECREVSEGRSEIAPQDDINQSPNSTGQDDIPNIVPDFSYISQYFVVFATCTSHSCIVDSYVPLESVMEQDQLPVDILMPNTNLAIVYGLHGLLMHLSPKANTAVALVKDSIVIPEFQSHGVQPTISHLADSAIISICYQECCNRLVSLDETGVVCWWKVDSDSSTLIGAPLVLPLTQRANSVTLSPSGEQIIVSYNDRLLLYQLNRDYLTKAMKPMSSSSKSVFYERCSLDILESTQCKYAVQFEGEMIRIWRFTNSVTESVGVKVTTWLHPNIDTFPLRKVSEEFPSYTRIGSTSTHCPEYNRNTPFSVSSETWPFIIPQGCPSYEANLFKPSGPLLYNKELSSEMDQDANSLKLTGDDPQQHLDETATLPDRNTLQGQSADVRQQQMFPNALSSSFVIYGNEIIPIYQDTLSFEYPATSQMSGTASEDTTVTNFRVSTTLSSSQDSIALTTSNPGLVLQTVEHPSDDYMEESHHDVGTILSPTLFRNAIPKRHSPSFYQYHGMFQPHCRSPCHATNVPHHVTYLTTLQDIYGHDKSSRFEDVKTFLSVLTACMTSPNVSLLCAALDCSLLQLETWIQSEISGLITIAAPSPFTSITSSSMSTSSLTSGHSGGVSNTSDRHEPQRNSEVSTTTATTGGGNHVVHGILFLTEESKQFLRWLCSTDVYRIGQEFWIDISIGHNLLCALYLKHCGNKSVAMEQSWQQYLQTYGPIHLRRSSRHLRLLTTSIRKIDETANIKSYLPYQIGYISGLQEIYARRVGLSGIIPKEIGQLTQLRVLSMGNNRLTGQLPIGLTNLQHLQRIVLHQNNLIGKVPDALAELGCIVNLAGNPRLEYGQDVNIHERNALIDFFFATKGPYWNTKTHWISNKPVSKWYKVGVLSSHVHSLVMSSNNMEGTLPSSIGNLKYLRMIELATMSGLTGPIPKELCTLTTLRRLCICRCGLTGVIPEEIGCLIGLEELQLFGNRLTGSIPGSLGNLINLKLLSLGEYTGGNHFHAEPIPTCISKLTKLEALFLANCNLKGALPTWIGDLTELRQLDLQRNQLVGNLPKSIGNLQNLLYLNIKDNHQLGGRLPLNELISLHKLNRLSLVHCNFIDSEVALEALKLALPRCKIWL